MSAKACSDSSIHGVRRFDLPSFPLTKEVCGPYASGNCSSSPPGPMEDSGDTARACRRRAQVLPPPVTASLEMYCR